MKLNFPHVTDILTGFGRLVPEISLPQLIGSPIPHREYYVQCLTIASSKVPPWTRPLWTVKPLRWILSTDLIISSIMRKAPARPEAALPPGLLTVSQTIRNQSEPSDSQSVHQSASPTPTQTSLAPTGNGDRPLQPSAPHPCVFFSLLLRVLWQHSVR